LTGFWSSKDELVDSLRAYTSHLAARNKALARIAATSAEIRSTLAAADTPDISDALRRRDADIARFSSLCDIDKTDEAALDAAMQAANAANGELAELARSVVALREDSRALAEDVLACQGECEALLKARVEATAKALRQSTRRRKLDAAYGQAVNHQKPAFVDKQQ
jgi:hypothetical protein